MKCSFSPRQTHTTSASLNLGQDACVCVCVSSARLQQKQRLLPVSSAACHNMLESPSGSRSVATSDAHVLSSLWMLDRRGHVLHETPLRPPARGSVSSVVVGCYMLPLPAGATRIYLPADVGSGNHPDNKRSLVVVLKNNRPAARHSGPHPVQTESRVPPLDLLAIRQPPEEVSIMTGIINHLSQTVRLCACVVPSSPPRDGMHATTTTVPLQQNMTCPSSTVMAPRPFASFLRRRARLLSCKSEAARYFQPGS
ncbi:hypothetical protein QBC39DRAFT_366047 [Podospora conica]|nr:hypothetical protein QBC39DRAFT_366047 [Schizothecium conicum]